MLRSDAFMWGASLAVPSIFALPAAVYAGLAFVNVASQLLVGRESPWPVTILGALVYGLCLSVLLPLLVLGTAAHVVWKTGKNHLEPWWSGGSWGAKAALWIGSMMITLPFSLFLAMLAYGGPALLEWLFSVQE